MNVTKFLFYALIVILGLNLNAKDLEPNFSLITSGSVTDIILKDEKLYASTTASTLDIFDIKRWNNFIDNITPIRRAFRHQIML